MKGFTQQELDTLQKAQIEKIRISGEETNMLQQQEDAKQKIREDAEAKRAAAEQKRQQQAAENESKKQKFIDDAIQKQKLELDLFIQQQGIKARSMQEELNLAQKIAAQKTAIAQAEFNASKKTANDRLQLDIANHEIKNTLAKAQVDVAVDNASRELKEYVAANMLKLDSEKFLSAELYNEKILNMDAIAMAEKDYQKKLFDMKVITQQEYDEELKSIDAANEEAKK
ncbi:MAG: hypothetical protein EOO03_18165, partial [Chitinophagaceae bacterium]